MVGVPGFEPGAFRSQSGRAAKLRHTPRHQLQGRNARSMLIKGTPCAILLTPQCAPWIMVKAPVGCSEHRGVPLIAPGLAGVAQWQSSSLPSWSCGFDSRHPLPFPAGQRVVLRSSAAVAGHLDHLCARYVARRHASIRVSIGATHLPSWVRPLLETSMYVGACQSGRGGFVVGVRRELPARSGGGPQ
jgi:hypothetical protein